MPTFAELRAKAEAAAASAKETANAKVADYRGDKPPESKWANYKPPPLRPATTTTAGASTTAAMNKRPPPPVPTTNRPGSSVVTHRTEQVQGYDVEVDSSRNDQRRQQSWEGHTQVADVEEENSEGLRALLENKAAFFQFMDEFFASKGLNLEGNSAGSSIQQPAPSLSRPSTPKAAASTPQRGVRATPQVVEVEIDYPNTEPASLSVSPPPKRVHPPIAPRPQRPVDKKIIQLINEDYDHKETEDGDKRLEEPILLPPPRRVVPPRPAASPPYTQSRQGSRESVNRIGSNALPDPVPSPPPARRPSVHSRPSSPPTVSKSTRPMVKHVIQPGTDESEASYQSNEPPRGSGARPSAAVLAAFGGLKNATPKETEAPPTPTRPVPPSVPSPARLPQPVPQSPRTPKPVVQTVQKVVASQQVTVAKTAAATKTTPPPFFTSFVSDENWTPSLPFEYMPRAGGKVTDGQCSAAQLCSYFAKNVEWDTWYASEDASARPAAIMERIEARWRGSVIVSQETKKRLFSSGKTTVEKTRIGVVMFQDLSIAWYRVIWKDDDPIKTLKREARYRATPGPWQGDKLYAAHLQYGQAITDFVEQAIQMRQFIGGGETRDLISGAMANVTKTKPSIPQIIPSIGHCHGHLIYEGYIFDGGQRAWGFPRGGETAIRNGDIIEWCDAEFQLTGDNGETTVLKVGESGYTSLILSAEEFPSPLPSDGHCLPPHRLPSLEIAMQSAASNQPPHVRTVHFSTMTRGRIWIFRCIGWDHVGVHTGREPDAEWPPPEPTLFLPEQ